MFGTAEHSGAGYLACIIAILCFATVYSLEKLGGSTVCKAGFRGFLADYAYAVSFCDWTLPQFWSLALPSSRLN